MVGEKAKEKQTIGEVPDCQYLQEEAATLVKPNTTGASKGDVMYLSNLDTQKFLRFSIKYLYVYKRCVDVEVFKSALSRALVEYYPLAGRLRSSSGSDGSSNLELDCSEEGALFFEGKMDMTVEFFMDGIKKPNRSWKKLLYRIEGQSFVDVPPLVIQLTHLRCGGMILCMAISHAICDGIGTSQFLNAWAQLAVTPDAEISLTAAAHLRRILKPRSPPKITASHLEFKVLNTGPEFDFDLLKWLVSQPLVPVSVTFTSADVLRLKQQCVPSLKCTSFEALASHVWRIWIRSLVVLPYNLIVKLLFSVDVRSRLRPPLPTGYYGNGFVLGCALATVENLVTWNLRQVIELIQEGKKRLDDDYVRSMVDLMEENRIIKPDLSASLVISQWSKLGLENLDFGAGKPVHMGPLASEVYCLFLPVVGDVNSFTVLLSVPENIAEEVEFGLKEVSGLTTASMEEDQVESRRHFMGALNNI